MVLSEGGRGAGFSSWLYCSRLRLPTSFPDGETPSVEPCSSRPRTISDEQAQ